MGAVGLRDHPPRFVEARLEEQARERIWMPAPRGRDSVIERDGVGTPRRLRADQHRCFAGQPSCPGRQNIGQFFWGHVNQTEPSQDCAAFDVRRRSREESIVVDEMTFGMCTHRDAAHPVAGFEADRPYTPSDEIGCHMADSTPDVEDGRGRIMLAHLVDKCLDGASFDGTLVRRWKGVGVELRQCVVSGLFHRASVTSASG